MTRFSGEQGKDIFDILIRHYTVIAPVEKPGKGRFSDTGLVAYERVESFDEIEFFKKTYFSAKSVLLPPRQTMFSFRDNKMEEADSQIRPTIIFLRSCDIHALKVLDAHFLNSGGCTDFYYNRLRQKVKLFLIECEKLFENCFCVSFQTNKTDNWAAFIRKVEGGYEVQIRDEELKAYFPDNAEDISGPQFVEQDTSPVNIPQEIDVSIFEDDLWKEYTLRCIACGRCTISCPTCSCFSVQDILSEDMTFPQGRGKSIPLDKSGGERKRLWSSCMVKKFSLLAGNHDLRTKEGDRLRYRVSHKIYDFRKKHGINMCVGCGRCDDVCPEYISMFKCVEKINQIIEVHSING